MQFDSLSFLLFFVVVYGLYWMLPVGRATNCLLLIASYLFYAAWNPPYVALLLVSTAIDWWLARKIGQTEDETRRRLLLVTSLVCNLCLLSYFKYGNFIWDNFVAVMSALHVDYRPMQSSIILPVGISFYTFASLSYTIDVYRREIRTDWRFSDYALFVSFFPHLIAGPIVRASYLLPQIVAPRNPSSNQVGWGLAMIVIGLFSKVVLADGIFAPVVDRFYGAPASFGLLDAWTAVLSFSGQIYFDFSGYSLCAIGLALCFGYSFPENFHHPYAARSVSDFWRRWHISLSSWLRDYLYIPLGGNRHGTTRTCIALMLTMLIGGLWHGASWMFVLWGCLHGSYLLVELLLRRLNMVKTRSVTGPYRLSEFFIFILITLTWIPFRASNPAEAFAVAQSLVDGGRNSTPMAQSQDLIALTSIFITVGWHIFLRDRNFATVMSRLAQSIQLGVFSVCLICLYLYSGGDQRAFLYFQF